MQTFYRNELFKVIEKSKIDPSLFEILEGQEDGHNITAIKLTGTDHQFTIKESTKSFDLFSYKYTLNQPQLPETNYRRLWLPLHWVYRSRVQHKFKKVRSGLKRWIKVELKNYFRDIESQDLWQLALSEPIIHYKDHNRTDDEEFFDNTEKVQIRKAIQQARTEITIEVPMDEDRMQALDDKMEYLINSVERLNKFDWRSVLVASALDVASNVAVDAFGAKAIMDIFRSVFASIPKLLGK